MLKSVLDWYKTQEMRERAVLAEPCAMESVPDQYKSQEICAKASEQTPYILKIVADWFVTPKMLGNFDNDDLITWHNERKQCNRGETDRHRFITYGMTPFLIQDLVCPIRWEDKD